MSQQAQYESKSLAEFYTHDPLHGAAYYDINAAQYGIKNGAIVNPARHYFFYRILLGYVRSLLKEQARVADIGCGMGILAGMCSDICGTYVGMDIALERVKQARQRSPSAKCFWVVGDAQKLPFKKGSFNQVISLEVIEHVPDTAEYLSDINRILVDGGTYICSTPGSFFYHDNRALLYRDQHLYQFNLAALKRLLKKNSFIVRSSLGVGFRLHLIIPVWMGSDVIKFIYSKLARVDLKAGYGSAISLEWDIVAQPWAGRRHFFMKIAGAIGKVLPGLSSTMVVECRK